MLSIALKHMPNNISSIALNSSQVPSNSSILPLLNNNKSASKTDIFNTSAHFGVNLEEMIDKINNPENTLDDIFAPKPKALSFLEKLTKRAFAPGEEIYKQFERNQELIERLAEEERNTRPI